MSQELFAALSARSSSLISEKASAMQTKMDTYVGSFKGERWVSQSLVERYPEAGEVVELDVELVGNSRAEYIRTNSTDAHAPDGELLDVKMPPAALENGFAFVGGNKNRCFYLNEAWLEQFPLLSAWWNEKGDSHLLASMFLRPGKLATDTGYVSLEGMPRVDGDMNDGLLFTLDAVRWEEFVNSFSIPSDSVLVQCTVFSPKSGVVAKGTIRKVLEGETAAVFTGSWKFLSESTSRIDYSEIALLTNDAAYSPQASVNLQAYTYNCRGAGRGKGLAEWMFTQVSERVQSVIESRYNSAYTPAGYLSMLGLPVTQELLDEVYKGQEGALYDCLSKWPVNRKFGWRGKVNAAEGMGDKDIMLPLSWAIDAGLEVGSKVYVDRNPALPLTGFLEYTVTRLIEGNIAIVSGKPGSPWNSILGGDFDGDDIVIFARCPFQEYHYPEGINLQEFKATGRALGAKEVESRQERWLNEVSANIGRWDLIARYYINLNDDSIDREVLLELTRLIQLTISLKKRVGEVTPGACVLRQMSAMRDMKEYTETFYIRNFRESSPEYRAEFKADCSLSDDLARIVEMVEGGLEAIQQPKSKFSLRGLSGMAKGPFSDDVMQLAVSLKRQVMALHQGLYECKRANDNSLRNAYNRELKWALQVEMPEAAFALNSVKHVELSWALASVNMPVDAWVFMAHPSVLYAVAEQTFKGEAQTLYSKNELVGVAEGDKVVIAPWARQAVVGEQLLNLGVGFLACDKEQELTVVKVYGKSIKVSQQPTLASAPAGKLQRVARPRR